MYTASEAKAAIAVFEKAEVFEKLIDDQLRIHARRGFKGVLTFAVKGIPKDVCKYLVELYEHDYVVTVIDSG